MVRNVEPGSPSALHIKAPMGELKELLVEVLTGTMFPSAFDKNSLANTLHNIDVSQRDDVESLVRELNTICTGLRTQLEKNVDVGLQGQYLIRDKLRDQFELIQDKFKKNAPSESRPSTPTPHTPKTQEELHASDTTRVRLQKMFDSALPTQDKEDVGAAYIDQLGDGSEDYPDSDYEQSLSKPMAITALTGLSGFHGDYRHYIRLANNHNQMVHIKQSESTSTRRSATRRSTELRSSRTSARH